MNYVDEINKFKPNSVQEINDKKVILDYIKNFKDNVLTRTNEVAHLTSSAIILNKKINKMLMIHHNIYNTWTWTGGHADGDSDLLNVAIKEAKEETGITNIIPLTTDVFSLDILPVYGHIKRGKYVSCHLHLNVTYVLIADEEDKLVVNTSETSGVKWVDINKLDEYSNESYVLTIYKKIIDRALEVNKVLMVEV